MGTSLSRYAEDPAQIYRWHGIEHPQEEERRLQQVTSAIAALSVNGLDNIPAVPCLSADGHLLVLSASASRVRFGTSATFIMVYPHDVKTVLPKDIPSQPLSSHSLDLWCIFEDGSATPAYGCDFEYGNDRASLLDCPLSPFASEQLWGYNRPLRIYLASLTNTKHTTPILKARILVPRPAPLPSNSSHQRLTFCTSPLHSGAEFLTQWILFHRLVGVSKFVVYNSTDTDQRLRRAVDTINTHYPHLVDVVQWNFSSLALTDVMSTRYFQTEALHDCLIRYGDQSEWLGMLDLDEYLVPMPPYATVLHYLHDNFGRRIIGSINLWSQFFCMHTPEQYTAEEGNMNDLVIERFVVRAADLYRAGREKYLYRPRFVQYLSIHHQLVGLGQQEPSPNGIMLAHYAPMARPRTMPGCTDRGKVNDHTVRDRFASKLRTAMQKLTL